jgi:hypothetical protein
MDRYTISASSVSADMIPVGLALHELLNHLPVTIKSRDNPGIRVEEGRVVDTAYEGPVLIDVIRENRTLKKTPDRGPYKGVPVIVTPVRDDAGMAVWAIGVVDITGIFDLATLMEHQSAILQQVCGKDPCPLPGEQVGSKR